MSKYTTEVRFICETLAGLTESKGFQEVSDILDTATPLLFGFEFPIFSADYKIPLGRKILEHYYTREIGFETVGLWKMKLQTKLREIMPYYNKLYESELMKYDLFTDVNLTRTHKGSGTQATDETTNRNTSTTSENTRKETSGRDVTDDVTRGGKETITKSGTDNISHSETTSGESSGTGKLDSTTTDTIDTHVGHISNTESTDTNTTTTLDKYSDTPQGALSGVQDGTYLTNARQTEVSGSGTNKGQTTGQDDTRGTNTSVVDGSNSYSDKKSGTSSSTEERSSSGTENKTDSGTENRTVVENGNHNTTDKGSSGSDENGTLDRDIKTTDEWIETIIGKQSTQNYPELILKYRETLLNIDMMVINALEDLFFGLW